MGRRKIEIAPIQNERNRSVTFLKRKTGLFKKAYELGVLCSVDVCVIVFETKAGQPVKLHQYTSSPDIQTILQRKNEHNGETETKYQRDFLSDTTGDDDDDDGPVSYKPTMPLPGGPREHMDAPYYPRAGGNNPMYGGSAPMIGPEDRYNMHGSAHKRPRLEDDVGDPGRPYPHQPPPPPPFYTMPPPMPAYGSQPGLSHFSTRGPPPSNTHPSLSGAHHSPGGYPAPPSGPGSGLYSNPGSGAGQGAPGSNNDHEYRQTPPGLSNPSSNTPRSGSPLLPQWSTLNSGDGGKAPSPSGPGNSLPTITGGTKNGRLADLMSSDPSLPPPAKRSKPGSPIDEKGSEGSRE